MLERLMEMLLASGPVPKPQPPSAERVAWAHRVVAEGLAAQGIFPASELTPDVLRGAWVALCWVSGCPAKGLDEWLEQAAAQIGKPFEAAGSNGAAAVNGAAASTASESPQVEAAGDRGEIVARVQGMIDTLKASIDYLEHDAPNGDAFVRSMNEGSLRTFKQHLGTLAWVLDPNADQARGAHAFYKSLTAAVPLMNAIARKRSEKQAAGVA